MKIMTIGGATIDTILEYKDPETLNLQSARGTLSYLLLEEGKKLEVTWLGNFSGGGGTNSAVAFKRLGFEVVVSVCKIGQDKDGDAIIAELTAAGVETGYIQRDDKERTACSYIIPSLKGDRTVFAYRGANGNLAANDFPLVALADCQQLYITSLSGNSSAHLPLITAAAKQAGVPVAINPGISQLRLGSDFIAQSLGNVDILIVNSSEAKQLMASLFKLKGKIRRDNPPLQTTATAAPALLNNAIIYEEVSFRLAEFFELVLQLGPHLVVVTHGDEGVYVADTTTIYFHPALKETVVVNTLGAGDAFGATFVAAIAQHKSIDEAIRAGVINSASVVGYQDAKTGLLTDKQLNVRMREVSRSKLQTFSLTSIG